MTEPTIVTVGTLYLGGQQHGFPPGTVLTLPSAQAEALLASGQAVEPAPPAPDPAPG